MTSAARRTRPVRYPERRHSQCRFARRSDACRRGRPSCVPRFGASWSETLPEKRRWLNRQFVPTGRLYVRCGCRAVRLYPYRSSRPPPARYVPRHARPRRYRTSTLSRICTPGNPSRVGGDKRMGTRGAAKILPRCFGRSDRRALYQSPASALGPAGHPCSSRGQTSGERRTLAYRGPGVRPGRPAQALGTQ